MGSYVCLRHLTSCSAKQADWPQLTLRLPQSAHSYACTCPLHVPSRAPLAGTLPANSHSTPPGFRVSVAVRVPAPPALATHATRTQKCSYAYFLHTGGRPFWCRSCHFSPVPTSAAKVAQGTKVQSHCCLSPRTGGRIWKRSRRSATSDGLLARLQSQHDRANSCSPTRDGTVSRRASSS